MTLHDKKACICFWQKQGWISNSILQRILVSISAILPFSMVHLFDTMCEQYWGAVWCVVINIFTQCSKPQFFFCFVADAEVCTNQIPIIITLSMIHLDTCSTGDYIAAISNKWCHIEGFLAQKKGLSTPDSFDSEWHKTVAVSGYSMSLNTST